MEKTREREKQRTESPADALNRILAGASERFGRERAELGKTFERMARQIEQQLAASAHQSGAFAEAIRARLDELREDQNAKLAARQDREGAACDRQRRESSPEQALRENEGLERDRRAQEDQMEAARLQLRDALRDEIAARADEAAGSRTPERTAERAEDREAKRGSSIDEAMAASERWLDAAAAEELRGAVAKATEAIARYRDQEKIEPREGAQGPRKVSVEGTMAAQALESLLEEAARQMLARQDADAAAGVARQVADTLDRSQRALEASPVKRAVQDLLREEQGLKVAEGFPRDATFLEAYRQASAAVIEISARAVAEGASLDSVARLQEKADEIERRLQSDEAFCKQFEEAIGEALRKMQAPGKEIGREVHAETARHEAVSARLNPESRVEEAVRNLFESPEAILRQSVREFVQQNAAVLAARTGADAAQLRAGNLAGLAVDGNTLVGKLRMDALYVNEARKSVTVLDWHTRPNAEHAAKTELYKLILASLSPPGWTIFGRDVSYAGLRVSSPQRDRDRDV